MKYKTNNIQPGSSQVVHVWMKEDLQPISQ